MVNRKVIAIKRGSESLFWPEYAKISIDLGGDSDYLSYTLLLDLVDA